MKSQVGRRKFELSEVVSRPSSVVSGSVDRIGSAVRKRALEWEIACTCGVGGGGSSPSSATRCGALGCTLHAFCVGHGVCVALCITHDVRCAVCWMLYMFTHTTAKDGEAAMLRCWVRFGAGSSPMHGSIFHCTMARCRTAGGRRVTGREPGDYFSSECSVLSA